MRLAEHVEHTTDVDGMLDRMTPQQFDEWVVKDRIEPIGYATEMLSLIAYMMACYMKAEDSEPVKHEDFAPWIKYRPKQDQQETQQARTMMRSIFGIS